MDFLLGIFIFLIGTVIGMSFMIFAPLKIRTKITDALNPDAKVTSEQIVSTTSSSYFDSGTGSSSYFDSGSGSTFLRGSSSNS